MSRDVVVDDNVKLQFDFLVSFLGNNGFNTVLLIIKNYTFSFIVATLKIYEGFYQSYVKIVDVGSFFITSTT